VDLLAIGGAGWGGGVDQGISDLRFQDLRARGSGACGNSLRCDAATRSGQKKDAPMAGAEHGREKSEFMPPKGGTTCLCRGTDRRMERRCHVMPGDGCLKVVMKMQSYSPSPCGDFLATTGHIRNGSCPMYQEIWWGA
jgi:hypothetical protein